MILQHNWRIWIWTVLFLAASPSSSLAQTVRGRVLDELGEGPVPGVVVSLLDQDGVRLRSVLTNRDGTFLMAKLTPGRHPSLPMLSETV